MKKQLMATTALVAGGMIAGVAQAAEPIKLSLGGYATTGLTVRSQDNVGTAAGADDRVLTVSNGVPTTTDPSRADQFWEAEVWFVGETTLDNGIKVGVNIQLEAYTSGDQIDEHYVYVQGGFGRLVVGAENSAQYTMHYAAPSPTGGQFGADSPNFLPFRAPPSAANASVFTATALTSDANKITYFTPRFAPGFQFGISYTPDDEAAGANGSCRGGCVFGQSGTGGNAISDNDTAGHHNFVEGAVNFVRSINGVDLAFDVGFGAGFVEKQNRAANDQLLKTRYTGTAGFNVGYAGFTFGGGFRWDNNGAQGPNDVWAATLGVTYGAGPWLVGVNAGYTVAEDGRRQDNAAAGGYVGRTNDSLIYAEVGGQYTLGPGIRVFSTINFADWQGNGTATEEATGVAWSTGLRLSF